MKNSLGNNIILTLFGESHGPAIGAVLDGFAPGIAVDEDFIAQQMAKRRGLEELSTKRREGDEVTILSGVFEGKTTGTPITFLIENKVQKSGDYSENRYKARPSHADYTALCKYHGFEDYRGGGHFSGRLTAPIVAAGALAIAALKKKGIFIGTHILECATIRDAAFSDLPAQIAQLEAADFPMLSEEVAVQVKQVIAKAKEVGDSVGGILETAVIGLPAGVGEPFFDSVESALAHALFSIPAVKGVEFGSGFEIAKLLGSRANDAFQIENGKIITASNHNGGINGGITNGMPLLVRTAVKPTPSIFKEQNTIDLKKGVNTTLKIKGRHDPAIVHRARVVQDSLTALVLCDLLATRYGTDWLAESADTAEKKVLPL